MITDRILEHIDGEIFKYATVLANGDIYYLYYWKQKGVDIVTHRYTVRYHVTIAYNGDVLYTALDIGSKRSLFTLRESPDGKRYVTLFDKEQSDAISYLTDLADSNLYTIYTTKIKWVKDEPKKVKEIAKPLSPAQYEKLMALIDILLMAKKEKRGSDAERAMLIKFKREASVSMLTEAQAHRLMLLF